MELVHQLFFLFKHLNDKAAWENLIGFAGHTNLYIVLFAIIFAETGLVILPFLPGDSLLFAIGAIAAKGVGISLPVVVVLLIAAAVIGDAVNYWIGNAIGPKVFSRESSTLLNKKHLLRAQAFYDKYGGKTIILARFVPVVRTFAPFVAGIGKMSYPRFLAFNCVGGAAWVLLCVLAGWLLGGMTFVQRHFELVLMAVVLISIVPMAIEFIKARQESKLRGFEVSVSPEQR